MVMKKILYTVLGTLLLAVSSISCSDDFLNTASSTSVNKESVIKDARSLHGLLNGLHNMMYMYAWGDATDFCGVGHRSLCAQLDMMGDDMINTNPAGWMSIYRYQDHINPNGDINAKVWDMYYTLIHHANLLIYGTESNKNISEEDKNVLLGEGYAFRAMSYHILVQLFGHRYVAGGANDYLGVPLRLSTDSIAPMARNTVAEVYSQIDKDITKSLSYLKNVPDRGVKNVISYSAALGIAARIDLSKSDWEKAKEHADEAIKHTSATLQSGKALLDGFNNLNASEWIWGYRQASDQDNGYFSFYANYSYNFIGYNQILRYAVNRDIYDKMGKNDARRGWWVALDQGNSIPTDANPQYFPNNGKWEITGQSIKFKAKSANNGMGDALIMRLAELYYIKAEAEARLHEDDAARETLNTIMKTRDPDYNTKASGEELIEEIMRNKRIDLWMEGQRFFDIKRLGIVFDRSKAKNFSYLKESNREAALNRNRGANALNIPKTKESVYWQFAIPYQEIKANKELIKQNPLSE